MSPLQAVNRIEYHDDVLRIEVLACGHKKTTYVWSDRPAKRRRCDKCEAQEKRRAG